MGGSAGNDSSPPTVEIDWKSEECRRCITACLVKGTYILESQHESSLAPAWWEKFHFRLHRVLESGCNCVCCNRRRKIFGDQSTRSFFYGAIFEYVPPADDDGAKIRHPSLAPHYVVAFRGTMPRDATVIADMRINLRLLLNKQHYCGRFTDARWHVTSLLGSTPPAAGGHAVADATNSNSVVWLAGHSLGASIALDVGRDMVTTRGCYLPTFLFNPPHVSVAPLIDYVMSEEAKRGLYNSSYVLKWALGMAFPTLRSHRKYMEEVFRQLSPWKPNLYVHPRDVICMGFIDHFQKREEVKELSTCVANSAATLSYRDMAYTLLFRQQSEQQHLLPCAVIWTSSHPDDPHGLQQWCTGPELGLRRDEYSWRPLI